MTSHARNRESWDRMSDAYQAAHQAGRKPGLVWGVWQIPETDLQLLGEVDGKDVLEFGCGAAEVSSALVALGARCFGLDASARQLEHALSLTEATGTRVPLVQAVGEATPFRDASFDIVVADYGVFLWVDPYLSVPEAARVLRPGGLLAFSTLTPLLVMCWPVEKDPDPPGRVLETPYFGMHAQDVGEEGINYNLPYGDWIRLFRDNGLVVEDLIEVQAPEDAPDEVDGRPRDWARNWPAEHFWKARKL